MVAGRHRARRRLQCGLMVGNIQKESGAWDSGLIGHERVRGLLSRMLEKNAVPQVVLLEGCAHVGKSALAQAFARHLLGMGAVGELAAHPDCVWLAPEQEGESIKVEAVQEATARMAQGAWGGGYKVLIVDGIERASDKAANALLKSLEEPSGRTCVILIAHRMGTVLATLRSRAVCYSLFPLVGTVLADALTARGAPAARLPRLLALAGGRPGLALAAMADAQAMAAAESQAERAAQALAPSPALRVRAGLAWLPPRTGATALARAELIAVAEQYAWQLRDEYLKGVGLASAAQNPLAPMRISASEACRLLPRIAKLTSDVRGNVHPPLSIIRAIL